MANNTNISILSNQDLVVELSQLIEQSKKQVASQVNSAVTILFWQIGNRINQDILQNKRAEYSKQIVSTVSTQLKERYGKNFELRNLRRMMQFAEQFTDFQIVVPLSRQLSWSHFVELLPLKTIEAKLFYAQNASNNLFGIRELRRQIALKTFERTSIADAQIVEATQIPFNTFKDPYILDLLGLQDSYLEKDLENAILHDLETFILELGKGFSFVERQKRMIIDGEDFNLDLLFYHRKLKRLVAIELKLGKFQAKHKGQMELYLKWLDKYEKQDGENTPIGLILCAESSREQIELLEMHKDGIMVAEYWTDLPPKKQFEEKIHLLLIEARERIERKKLL
ncbi:YhcG family protein [Flavobacterium sp.]|jgi:predicted nuclease of restriction endonuclease-like (RecB) superfamily|uniref:YhcG family protein n=1 Tax=Flavobacterium sp. TaxID=239 RepID=UPI0037BE4FCE